jgi:ubiquinone/menaquinone biosynthesis C-methylase UbiE
MVHNPAKLFADHVQPGMTTADIGCGMGYFSLGLARLVQPGGKVLAIDLQPQMLRRVRQRAEKAGLAGIIETHLSNARNLDIPEPLDFALTFWMIHETPDAQTFFSQIKNRLKPKAKLMIAEPKMHVNRLQFEKEMTAAFSAGFKLSALPSVAFSHAAVLTPNT